MKTRSWLYSLFAILLAFSLVATACGNDDDDPGTGPAPSTDDSGDDMADDSGDDMADDSGDDGATDDSGDDMADDSGDDGAADDSGDDMADDAVVIEEIGPPEDTVVTVCDAPSFTQIYAKVMANRGFAENRGFQMDFVACHSGAAQAAALVSGQVDIALNTPDNMLGIRNADFDVVMFAQVVDNHFFDIVVSNNFGEIDCPQGDWECAMAALNGTRVGVVARGVAAEQIARQLLDSAGFDPDDSTYIATGLAGTTLAALDADEVDWAITFEPGLSTAELDDIGYAPFRLRAGDGPTELDWPSAIMLTARSYWDANPNTVLHYRAAILEAMEWLRDPANRDAVLEELDAHLGLDPEMAAYIFDNNIGSMTVTAELDPVRITNNVNYAVGRGILGAAQEFGEFAVGPGIDVILPAALVPEATTVGICQAPSFNGMIAHIAVEEGFLSDRGVTGEFIQCPSGPANAAALIAGEVQFVGNTPDNMLGIRNAGFDVVMFQQLVDKHFFDIVVSNNFGPIDCEQGDWQCAMQELEGTNVGVVARGAAAEQIARQLIDSAGLDPDGATYIATGLSGTTLAALSSGEVDWAITFEPGLSQAAVDDIGYAPFALRAGEGPTELDWPSLVNTTSRQFAEENPNTVAIFARASRQAMDFMRNPANREAVLAYMRDFLSLEGAVAETIFDSNIGSLSLNGALQPARLQNNVDYAVGRGILEEAQDFDDFTVSP
ncbi:ABC transporter substrate-binding protein [Candidatus Poriferisocius sp.]|uniref:ABC transporter substrate-binding protein n=1 Tax=Candidatus Poriferisocius sp. TaxID=3101276 RepID=UPI003B01F6D5